MIESSPRRLATLVAEKAKDIPKAPEAPDEAERL